MTKEELKEQVVFIPVSDIEHYSDWDMEIGYGNVDQIFFENGIVVKKEDEKKMSTNVQKFEKYLKD